MTSRTVALAAAATLAIACGASSGTQESSGTHLSVSTKPAGLAPATTADTTATLDVGSSSS